jgi:hypothetical protein
MPLSTSLRRVDLTFECPGRKTMGMKGLDLDTVIRRLHRSEIRVGIQTFSGGILIWISDRSTRVRAERVFDDASPMTIDDTAVEWMHSTALRKFPDSNYAIQYGLRAPPQRAREEGNGALPRLLKTSPPGPAAMPIARGHPDPTVATVARAVESRRHARQIG